MEGKKLLPISFSLPRRFCTLILPLTFLFGLLILLTKIPSYPTAIPNLPNLPHVHFSTTRHNHYPPYNATKLALLIEDRPLPTTTPVLLYFISVVPPEWKFLYLGSTASIAFLNHSVPIRHYVNSGKLEMRELDPRMTLHGQEELSVTFTSKWFYEEVLGGSMHYDQQKGVVMKPDGVDVWGNPKLSPCYTCPEFLLNFQTDAMICSNSGQDINDWLQYDWVGAPWLEQDAMGGNGGLSLRRISKVLQVLNFQQRLSGTELEDLWLSKKVGLLPGARVPNGTVSKLFSVESVWYDTPLGYHTGWQGLYLPHDVWGTREKREWILKGYCPEMRMATEVKSAVYCKEDESQG